MRETEETGGIGEATKVECGEGAFGDGEDTDSGTSAGDVWVFDHSSCHAAMADDALDVNAMNVKPGGKQRIMKDTIWNGKEWHMYTTAQDGTKVTKGMKMVLEECRVSTAGIGADWMREMLAKHSDFRDKKSMIEHVLVEKGMYLAFCQSFTLSLTQLRECGLGLSVTPKHNCKYSLLSLRKNIPLAYDTVTLENIQNHFRISTICFAT